MAFKMEEAAYADFLEQLHKIYSGELKQDTASYRDIREYFTVITKDTAPLALSDDMNNESAPNPQLDDLSTSSSEDSSSEGSPVVFQRQCLQRCHLFKSSLESSEDSSGEESPVLVQQ
jgi:hypothetical protein